MASNHSASLVSDSASTSRINVTWDSSEREEDEFGCILPYCRGARRYQVNLRTFNSVPENSDVEPDSETGFVKTAKRRLTYHDFDIPGSVSSSGKIYDFQTRNERDFHFVTRIPFFDYVQVVTSKPFHFGPPHGKYGIPKPHGFRLDLEKLASCLISVNVLQWNLQIKDTLGHGHFVLC